MWKSLLFALLPLLVSHAFVRAQSPIKANILQVERIWDRAPHNAFTDLVRWQDKWYCAFREGERHVGDRGKLRIIVSPDGRDWNSAALLEHSEYDLRDAALSVTPEGRLMVLCGSQQVVDGQRTTGTLVTFSQDGRQFSELQRANPQGRWLWRVTWHGDTAYGVSYATPDRYPFSSLLATTGGVDYETVVPELLGEGRPTEARLRFAEDGTCYCLHRRDGENNSAYWGEAAPPYTDWKWHDLGRYVGGPNFLQIPSGEWIGAGRLLEGGAHTALFQIDAKAATITPLLRLPSGGDTSYPGMVWHDGALWMSYYSSHEGSTSIYLARVELADSTDE